MILPVSLRVTNGLNLLVIVAKGFSRDLVLPMTAQSGHKPEKEEETDDQHWQQERWRSRFSRQGERETLLLRADREAFKAADTFTIAYSLSGGDLNVCRADCLASFAVNAQLWVTSDLKGAENGQKAKEAAIGAEIAAPEISYHKGQGDEHEHDRAGKQTGCQKEMEHLGVGDQVVG